MLELHSHGRGADGADQTGVDPEAELMLRKLTKKDPITKIKALKELAELLSAKEKSELVALLPSWVCNSERIVLASHPAGRHTTSTDWPFRTIGGSGKGSTRCVSPSVGDVGAYTTAPDTCLTHP